MALTPGTRLGVYEVTAQIGEGGMGQVYRATDTKLKRQVAIKILPPAVAADHDRLARFQREAEVLASLNHPNIAVIYGLEEGPAESGPHAGGGRVTALVMELVEGDDLSQRIAGGAIPLDDALPIAKQIADALEAAHEQGIVHRDLKPANIKIRADGTVKVLDFGLAKAIEGPGGSGGAGRPGGLSMSPTLTTPAMTLQGVILGATSRRRTNPDADAVGLIRLPQDHSCVVARCLPVRRRAPFGWRCLDRRAHPPRRGARPVERFLPWAATIGARNACQKAVATCSGNV